MQPPSGTYCRHITVPIVQLLNQIIAVITVATSAEARPCAPCFCALTLLPLYLMP